MKIYPIPHPRGSDTEIQYNKGGIFGGDSTFTFNDATKDVTAQGLIVTNCLDFGANSAVFQPNADSTTFFQVLDAAGTANCLVVDSTNERVGINCLPTETAELRLRNASTNAFYTIFLLEGPHGCYFSLNSDAEDNYKIHNDYGNLFCSNNTDSRFDWVINGAGSLFFATDGKTTKFGAAHTSGAATTLVELESGSPYLTLHNSTHEDADGGRESRLNFKGEQSGGEETTLARIEASHDGAVDDQKGKIVISTNDGSDGDAPTDQLAIQSTGDWVINKTSGVGLKVDVAAPTFGWRDLLGEPKGNNTGATKPTFATYRGGLYQYQFAAGDEDYWEFHIPHDYVPGTDVYLHIHWSHNSAIVTGGTVTFEVESSYAKGHNQAAFSAPATGTFTGTASTTQYQHIISETQYSASAPAGLQIDTDDLEPDGVIIMRVDLSANNITSSGAVPDPFIHFVDIHYQTNGVIGTKQKAPNFYV